jgi:hypothetical protein
MYFTVGDQIQDVLPQTPHPGGMWKNRLSQGWIEETSDGAWRWQTPQAMSSLPLTAGSLMAMEATAEEWEPDWLARTEEGEWRTHPDQGWLVKSGRLHTVPAEARLPQGREAGWIVEQALVTCPPWRFTDFDARLPGAATYAQTWAETGAFLQQVEAETGVPLIGKGDATWLWSGLLSGMVPEGIARLHPYLPQASWSLMHPGTVLLGLGGLDSFQRSGEDGVSEWVLADRALAAQIAYGATGFVPWITDDVVRRRFLRFTEVLHPRLASQNAERIAYWDGERFQTMTAARRGGSLPDSRLYIRLQDATEIWVNGHWTDTWEVQVDGTSYTLPPFGFVVRGPELFALSGQQPDGAAMCLLENEDSVWISSAGASVQWSGITAQGCVQLRKLQVDGAVEVRIADWQGPLRFATDRLDLSRVASVEAVDASGKALQSVTFLREEDEWVLRSPEPPARVRIYPGLRARENNFVP